MQQSMLGSHGNLVRLDNGHVGVDLDFTPGTELMADPAQPHIADIYDADHTSESPSGNVQERGIDSIHHAAEGNMRCRRGAKVRSIGSSGAANLTGSRHRMPTGCCAQLCSR